jgi:hypothetical protein
MRNIVASSYHQVIGLMSVLAYNSQTCNRPMYFIRVSPSVLRSVRLMEGINRTLPIHNAKLE